jgi:hypothetical protein
MSENQVNRRPFRAIGLKMPRCSLRFGVGACTATGSPKCHNLYWTCKDKENYTPTGSVEYVLVQKDVEFFDCYSVSDGGNTIRTGGIPALISARATPTEINLAGRSEGSRALGVRSTISARISGFPDSLVQPWVDFYLADRGLIGADFWQVLAARTNSLYPGAEVYDYQGYVGQALDDMQKRRYVMDAVTVPREGSITLSGRDPIMQALETEYPRSTEITLLQEIDDAQTTGITVSGVEADLDDAFGNTGARRFLLIGSEIIQYTGYSAFGADWQLTGVTRGAIDTDIGQHERFAACQRVAYHERQAYYEALRYIIDSHTPIPSDTLNGDTWDTEGRRFLSAQQLTGAIPKPTKFDTIAGELARDGQFSMWYDERDGELKIRAIRAPYAPTDVPVLLTDEDNIELLSPRVEVAPDERITRVDVLYNQRNPLGRDEFQDFATRRIRIDGETEKAEAGGRGAIPLRIESRWVRTNANALTLSAGILRQYRLPPKYVTIRADAKDRNIKTGTVIDLRTRLIIDTEGEIEQLRWIVRSCDDVNPGTRVELKLQSYQYPGRYFVIMADDAPNYLDATPEQRAFGGWLAGADGRMSNGDEPYRIY